LRRSWRQELILELIRSAFGRATGGQVRSNNPELMKIFLDHTPLARTGKPEDIVGPALFLASDPDA
jgi:NAD(P)-dependent dehydrogenase (short-subunit alcohol dehydrogenase family)